MTRIRFIYSFLRSNFYVELNFIFLLNFAYKNINLSNTLQILLLVSWKNEVFMFHVLLNSSDLIYLLIELIKNT